MHKKRLAYIPVIIILGLGVWGGWTLLQRSQSSQDNQLQVSGIIEAVEVVISPESSGKVEQVFVEIGQVVEEGDPLFQLDGALLQAQRQRILAGLQVAKDAAATASHAVVLAQAARDLAAAQLEIAQANWRAAQIQYQRALNAALLAEIPQQQAAWSQPQPEDLELPAWYFQKSEEITAVQAEVQRAADALTAAKTNLDAVLEDASGAAFLQAEQTLAEKRAAYQTAKEAYDQARASRVDETLLDVAQEALDTAESDLADAQQVYDDLLPEDEAAQSVLDARAQLALAQARYDSALVRAIRLQTGEQSLEVQAAAAAVRQAEAGVSLAEQGLTQAEAAIEQAGLSSILADDAVEQVQAELALSDLQIEKLLVTAPVSGVVLSAIVEKGEVVVLGAAAVTIGRLDDLSITVYLPEDRYGEVSLGESANLSVDSFPDKTFIARVTRIADQAEFTPRNVQTAEGRRSMVFAITLSIDDAGSLLKPGMPADVTFQPYTQNSSLPPPVGRGLGVGIPAFSDF
jgi:HlyD family secretion protein